MKSYLGKEFVIVDNQARIRRSDDLARFDGDKLIPKRTRITVTDARATPDKTTFVLARPIDAGVPSGWTKATNLDGGFLNERCRSIPAEWSLAPQGRNKTVSDAKALIRGGPPRFESTGSPVQEGTFVCVLETSTDGKFARICSAQLDRGKLSDGPEIGWTLASNLTDGCSDLRGTTACWRRGEFIGHKSLVDIVGPGGEMAQIAADTLQPYLDLVEAAAREHVYLGIESGFRTYRKQEELFKGWKAKLPGFNQAAEPGRSNHQHGQAFDLNTRGFDGDPIYDWLKKNGPRLGFIRTVSKEHWHWEFRPDDALQLRKTNKFSLPDVDP